jgi:hypothetical protein
MFIYDIFDMRSNELTNVITGILSNEFPDIIDINNNVDISITPNPAFNSFFINGLNEIAKISIFDLNGKLIYRNVSNNYHIDIKDYQSGIYIVKIESANETVIRKLIKQ